MKNTLNTSEINELFQKGKWLTAENISAIWMPSKSFGYMVSAPIKKFKKANKRNQVKRLLRANLLKNNWGNISIAFIYNSEEIKDNTIINNNINRIHKKLYE